MSLWYNISELHVGAKIARVTSEDSVLARSIKTL